MNVRSANRNIPKVIRSLELLLKWLTNPLVIQHVYEEGAPWSLEKVQEEFAEKVAEEGSATACIILYNDREVGFEPIDTIENYDDSSKQSVLMVKSI